jgi:hypothetical protein
MDVLVGKLVWSRPSGLKILRSYSAPSVRPVARSMIIPSNV